MKKYILAAILVIQPYEIRIVEAQDRQKCKPQWVTAIYPFTFGCISIGGGLYMCPLPNCETKLVSR